ncbi:hypothetical protein FGLOB1_8264 [Fusarium globosum]|uniref:Uncharacterized protein n=1 Tax=Fusarium globosum TaxID=78864 RepID=A0A8H5Y591_9HYPO|nr:hypothetical protein FGLOB1_8264 [Fusarium globosum]
MAGRKNSNNSGKKAAVGLIIHQVHRQYANDTSEVQDNPRRGEKAQGRRHDHQRPVPDIAQQGAEEAFSASSEDFLQGNLVSNRLPVHLLIVVDLKSAAAKGGAEAEGVAPTSESIKIPSFLATEMSRVGIEISSQAEVDLLDETAKFMASHAKAPQL